MLNLKNKSYFPAKLDKLVNSDLQIKYIIKEKSIMNYEVFLDDYTVEVK